MFPRRRPASDALQILVLVAGLLTVALVWVGLQYHLHLRQQSVQEQATKDVVNLSIGVEQHVERLIAGVDQVMRFIADDFHRDPKGFDFSVWLQEATSLTEVVHQIAMFDENGDLIASRTPRPPGTTHVNVRDRDYFKALAASPDRGLYIGRTVKGRMISGDAFQTARRLNHPDGRFAGVIVTAIDPDHLAGQFKAFDLGAQGSIALIGKDGFLRARSPGVAGMYELNTRTLDLPGDLFQQFQQKTSGAFRMTSPYDHVTRIYGYRSIGALPLIINVGKSLDEVMAPLADERLRARAAGIIVTLLLLAFLLILMRGLERGSRQRAALAEKELVARQAEAQAQEANRLLSLAAQIAHIGHWRIGLPGHTLYWSDEVFRIHGRSLEEGQPSLDAAITAYHPDDRDEVARCVAEAIETGRSFSFSARIVTADGRPRDVVCRGLCEQDADGATTAVFGTVMDVTDLRQTERAVVENEARYRLLADHTSDMVVQVDLDTTRRYVSPACRVLLGYEPEELIGTKPIDMVHPDDRPEVAALLAELGNGKRTEALKRQRYRRKDGTYVWVEVGYRIIHDHNGQAVGCVASTRNITTRVEAEQHIRESEARYRLLAENTSDVIIQSDLDTTRRYVSPACRDLLGYTPEEMIALRPMDCVHPDDAEAYQSVLDSLTSERVERTVSQQRYRRKDGTWIWTDISFTLTRDPVDGRATGYVAALRNIDARKRAERAAAESEVRYREVAETAHNAILAQLAEGVIVTDAAGRITLVNEAAAAIHGVARLDVEPDDYSASYHLYTEDGDPYVPRDLPLARAVRGESVQDARWRVRRPDGVEVLAIGSARPLVGRDGHPIGAVLTMRDDTGRDAAECSLRASEAALRELNATLSDRVAARTRDAEAARLEAERASAAKTDFLASMSHEIRTPLNAIIGFTELMVTSGRLPQDLQRQAELVRTSGTSLLTVVNDILDFSKAEAGAIELDRQAFDPRSLIYNSLAIVRGAADQKGLEIRAVIDPAVPKVLVGDEARLRQVLLNLLNNAIKFTQRGSVTLSIQHGGTDEAGERLRFSISDTGIGIARDRQDRLFKRFSQVDGSIERDFGGTGLGLAICKQLVDLMGGEIGVLSEAGVGATFWFSVLLPRGAAARTIALVTDAPAARRSGHLLLVEDNVINQELARSVLEVGGHTVDVVADGEAAIRAVELNRYDLVLMDVQMAGMDGMTATRHIRALGTTASTIPIIAMTANVLADQVQTFRAAGMDDHIGKPFKRAELYRLIDKWLAWGAGTAAADAGNQTGLLDQRTYDETAAFVTPERLFGLLEALGDELAEAFLGRSASAEDREQLRFEAHTLTTSTGMLGFLALSDACRALEGVNEQRVANEGLEVFQQQLEQARLLCRQTRAAALILLQKAECALQDQLLPAESNFLTNETAVAAK
ncbi:PAS domain S-box protein [Methylobacterium goesingense]|uniref:histidine kinase n=1 Tax=Methylobacterium goesingense TaxID=243690 RepID=A0ABV2L6X9_9HYPH|nr:PAS domain S-box protein [Methylobacterium goesingense]GJD72501.1 Sensor histidine kinase RcsC [Methylobacterium goesingense]